MSVDQSRAQQRPAEAVAGLLSAASIAVSLLGLAYRPGRVIPFALAIALISVAIGGRHQRLAAAAVAVGTICFVVGMAIAVLTEHPIF